MRYEVVGVGVTCLLMLFVLSEGKKIKEKDDCPVCITVMEKFGKEYASSQSKDQKEIEKDFMKFCKGLKGKEERFCYYIGGLETSATYILGAFSKPFKYHFPTEKICEKLYEMDQQICELKYEKQIDLATVDFKKLKVKDLKKILSDWGEACKGCTEKNDFLKMVKELMPKYNPEAAKKLKEKSEL